MENIVVAEKATSRISESAWGNISLDSPGVVKLPVAPQQVASTSRSGQNLLLTLKSGETITIGNFFVAAPGEPGSDLVFEGEDGVLWHAQYDAQAFTGFTFEEVGSLEELLAGVGTLGAGTSGWALAGLGLLGAGAVAVAVDNNDSSSSSSDDSPPGTVLAPPTDLLVSADGLRLTGRGLAGTLVTVRNAAGEIIGTGRVDADGRFDIELSSPQLNGEQLEASLSDDAGNSSEPALVSAPDITPPAPPTELALDSTGAQLTGRAEPGSRIEVRNAAGQVIGSGEVGSDGRFSITLTSAQRDGEVLDIRVVDAAGNQSPTLAFTAPDSTPPTILTNVVIGADGITISGRGEVGATVLVFDASGNPIGTGTVAANGTFSLRLDTPVNPGDSVRLIQRDAAGNDSPDLTLTVPDAIGPTTPYDMSVTGNGSQLSGSTDPNTRVEARDGDGNLLGSGVSDGAGRFTFTLTPLQANGEVVDVIAIDGNDEQSPSGQVVAPDITPPADAVELVVSSDGLSVSGRGEPGARVDVLDAQGKLLGSATVTAAGSFSVALSSAQTAGEVLQVRLTDAANNSNVPVSVTAPDLTVPLEPSALALNTAGDQLSGIGQAGSTITVKAADGSVLGSAVVAADGRFTVKLSAAQRNGQSLSVEAADGQGNIGGPVTLVAPDTQPPVAVSGVTIDDDGLVVSGQGEAGATVRVLDANGNELGSVLIPPGGNFQIPLSTAQTNAQSLTVIQRDPAGNDSPPTGLVAPDNEPPAQPTDLVLSANGAQITGKGEVGARAEVRGADDTLLGSAVVDANGQFVVLLSPPQLNGQTLTINLIDGGDNASPDSTLSAPDRQPPATPTDLALSIDGLQLSGRGEAGATVEVRDSNGNLLGSQLVDGNGTFTVDLNAAQLDGQTLTILQRDPALNASPSTTLVAEDLTPPEPVANLAVSDNGVILSGTGKSGAMVEVTADDISLGTVVVDVNGNFSVTLAPPQLAGQELSVTQTTPAGSSPPETTTAPDITPPDEPTDLAINGAGDTLSGTSEAGSTVVVYDAQGQEIGRQENLGSTGVFSIDLNPPLINGEIVSVVITDAAGNSTQPFERSAPDITPPDEASHLAINPTGDIISGIAEPGAEINVRDSNGNLLTAGEAGEDGVFIIPLTPPLIAGESVQIVVIDGAGNPSQGVTLNGPTGNEIATPTDVALSPDGFSVSGNATAGTTITVFAADGSSLGSTTVGSSGSFLVLLGAPQLNGQFLHVVASDPVSGSESVPALLQADDSTAPEAPFDLLLDSRGVILTGKGEAGATVTVTGPDNTPLGNAVVGSNGRFSLTLDPPQTNGQILSVSQTDAANNTSLTATVTARDLEAPPAAANLSLNAAATVVSGEGEAGANVTVLDAAGNILATGTVNQSGQFQVTLPSAQTSGAALQIVLSDAAGNASPVASLATPDRIPPAVATALTVSADGTQLSGNGEVGAKVEVRDANGTLLGTATVGSDGNFNVDLAPAQQAGQVLEVTLIDAAGNQSAGVDIDAPDIVPPDPLTNLSINNDGVTLTGQGEPGARVLVFDANGNPLGEGIVGSAGSFSIELTSAQLNAQRLSVTQTDAAGNVSVPGSVVAPDLTAPNAPSSLLLASNGLLLNGLAEAGSTVTVRDAQGQVLGTATAAASGSFQVTLVAPQLNGQALQVTATDAAGNQSQPAPYQAADVTAPLAATNLAVAATGSILTGHGEAGAEVIVRRLDDGQQLGTATVGADGRFSVTLTPPAVAGQSLTVVQSDAAGNLSPAAPVVAPGNLAPDTPSSLLLSGDGQTLTGITTAGSTVNVYGPDGNLLGSALATGDGTFSVVLAAPQTNGQLLEVSAVSPADVASQPAQYQAGDSTPPEPLTQLAVTPDGVTLTGRGEPGARVEVLGEGGILLGSATVEADGTFLVTLTPAQIDGDLLSASQTDAAGNESDSVSLTAPDLVAPDAPSNLSLSVDGMMLSGTGEAGAQATVRAADGTVLGTATVRLDGTFQVLLDSPQTNGQTLRVQLADAAGNQSGSTPLVAADTTAPDAVTALTISGDGVTLTGRGEPGAEVSVRDSDGNLLGTGEVNATGSFSVILNPPLGNAEVLQLVQTDAAGNTSPVANLTTPDFTPPDPLSNVAISANGAVVTGQGEAGASVTVRDANGTLLGTTTVRPDGSFSVTLVPPQIDKQQLTVQQADPPGNLSDPTLVTAPDLTPPAAPTDLRLNATGDQLGGSGEAGTEVRVTLADGTLLGSGQVAANGTFLIDIAPAQLNGQQLLVTLEDADNNVSPIASLDAPDVTPPAIPDNLQVDATGALLSGTAEPGARLTVRNASGDTVGSGQVNDDGTFSLNLVPPQRNGEQLEVIAQDATGNPSLAGQVSAPDLTPPAAPTGLSLSPDGSELSGITEPYAQVTVRGADNSVLGSLQADAQGNFVITLTPAQANGQVLSVTAVDLANNASQPASYTAADTTPPDPVSGLSINSGYNQLAGRGEPGATVTVSQGATMLGEAVVAANGTFVVTLTPPADAAVDLTVIQTDTAQLESIPVVFPTPDAPVPATPSDLALSSDGLTLSGAADPGTRIQVRAANGSVLGETDTGGDGRFTLQLSSPQTNGELLSIVAITASPFATSQPASFTADDTTAPAAPDELTLAANGINLTGEAEAGATVEVRDDDGNLLGSTLANADGTFAVNLSSPQLNGQTLNVRAIDSAGNPSEASQYTAADVQPPSAPSNLAVTGAGAAVSGLGEPGATVSVYSANGTLLGTTTVLGNGEFSVPLSPAQNNGQMLTVRQSDPSGNTSVNANVTAPDTTPPAAPTQVAINASGTQISGNGEAGATVTVRNAGGTVLGTGVVAANGTFAVLLASAQIDSQALNVTLTDSASNASQAVPVTAPDLTPPAAATALQVSDNGLQLTGTGEAGTSVTVRSATGTIIGTGVVQANGSFNVTLSAPQINGERLTVTLTDASGNVSPNASVTAQDVDADTPVVASDNLATATVNLAPVTTSKVFTDSFTTLLSGFSKTFTFTVASGNKVDPTLTLTTSSALALLDGAVFTLQVKNAAGNWITLSTGNSGGLLDLILLPLGQGLRVDIGDLLAGEYRLTVASTGIGLLTTVNTRLDIETTSLTQINGTPGPATTGNVITDVGVDGTRDITGPDNGAQLLVLKNGSYVATTGGVTVNGLYGTLTIDASGNYSYSPNGSAASVGKVDVFSYQLRHPNGLSDTANLYVRIDSPQATEIWNDADLGAPARVVDAVNDVDRSTVTLANRETTESATLGSFNVPLIGSNSASYTTTIAAGTTADLQVVINSNNLLGLLNGVTVGLYKLNPATQQYVLVKNVAGGSLVSLLGAGYGTTFEDQTAGTYQIRVSSGGVGLLSSVTTSLNTTTTYNNQFVVASNTPVAGNLLSNASGGSDVLGSAYTLLSVLVAGAYVLPGQNGVAVAGTYGTLLVQADGSYTYNLTPGQSSALIGQQETFTYRLTHPNGTSDTATLTINFNQAGTFSTLAAADEENLTAADGAQSAALASHAEQAGDSEESAPSEQPTDADGTLALTSLDPDELDGAADVDTLLWAGGDVSIDLGDLAEHLDALDTIDLNDSSAVNLTLSLADVLAVSAGETLVIKGDEQDRLHLADAWTQTGSTTLDGVDYTQYSAQEDPSHQLWVQSGIHVV